ncbi:MAG TPA: FadR/GntR family transcriptional regulator [Spirochaetia bacterium]|nr:FadR/GntR family transcriptional regulator [Spirochaetales bacterium]HRW25532.1 FadR/GntR family transcriptional regulator [Spirochaetia bacterium]
MSITKVRLSDQVFAELKRMIQDTELSPGDKFYSENELTAMLGVSRSSLREAIRLLEVAGFVTVQHGKGIFISDPKNTGRKAFEEWLHENETSLEEHFEIRLIIDPKAAASAANKADAADIARLREICQRFRDGVESGSTAESITSDEQFHLALAKSTKNKTLYMIMKTMTQSQQEGWISSLHVPGRMEKTISEHCAIVDAIEARDPARAERYMAEHLNNALADIRSSMHRITEEGV